jgi:hypothetical protein
MNQNYNFVQGLFTQVMNGKNEDLAKKNSTSFNGFLLMIVFALFASINAQGQTYFTESFEGPWYLNGNASTAATAAGPNAPSGWKQTRVLNDVVSAGSATSGAHDWAQSFFTTSYRSNTPPLVNQAPYLNGNPGPPPAGTGVLWFFDGGTSTGNTRRMEFPAVNLASSTNPVVSFSYAYAQNSTNLSVVGSIDNGVTWNTIAVLPSTSSTAYTLRSVALPSSYRIANAKIAFQIAAAWGSNDVFIDNVIVREAISGSATTVGGLWSSPATWVGGFIPDGAATIPTGSIVTVDQSVSVSSINVSGTLQWNATANAMTLAGDLTINSGARFLPYSTGGTGVTLNIGGNFQNNGYANLAVASTLINFNGSGSTLSGTGVFEGDGTRGIIRTLAFQNLGSNTVSTSQNLTVTAGLTHTGGSLNTNGKIRIDNTAQIYGQALNLQVASAAVTNMGSLYTVAPVVFGQAVVPYANALLAVLGTRYFNGNNVYLCTTAGTFNSTPPTSTSPTTFTTSGPTLIWIGTLGTLGTNVPFNGTLNIATQYFYGDNVYQAIATTATTTMPVHTSGTVGGFRYLGTVAKATINFDSVTGTVRSLNLTQPGSGFSTAPAIAISRGLGDTTGINAAATAVLFQQIAGNANVTTQKSGGAANITGGLTINSDQGASVASSNVQASSGVGAISTTSGGLNYTVAPLVGFAGPTAINLVTNAGSGYITAPTVVVTGGTLVSASATPLAATNFTVTVNQGKVVSVYLNSTTVLYSVPPTLSFSTGNATIAFPTGCWPAATANLGSNGQITSFTMTNAGFGYVAAPSVGVGTTSGTLAGGTFTTAATAPTARIALYNLTLNWFAPAVAAVVSTDDAAIPANRKMNNLSLSGNGIGLNLTNNLVLFGSSPLTLTASATAPGNVLNLGGNNLLFTWNGYAGTTTTYGATKTYITNGSMTLTGRGGGTSGSTFNFPFSGAVTVFTGGAGASTAVTGGTDALTVKVTEVGAPTNTVTGGTGIALGNRAFKVETATTFGAAAASPSLFGTNATVPTVRLNYNEQDGLTTTQPQTIVLESTSLNGAWNTRSAAIGASGPLAATGGLTTGTVAPTLALFNSGNFYAWGTGAPTISGIDNTTLCANSGAFSLSGTNFLGVTAVKIGGTDVLTFTVVNDTTITGFAGSGTTGNISVTKNGVTVTGIQNITVSPSPIAPTVSTSTVSINLGGTVTVTASGGSGTFRWYNDANAGTLLFTGATFSAPVCSGNLWVAEFNGSCEGARRMVTITIAPTAIVSSATSFCGVGSPVTLTASPADATITYSWSSLTSPATVAPATGASSITSSLSQTSDFRLTATKGTCTAVSNISIGVYPLPSATVTTTAQGVCPGTGATIGSGLVAGNFAVSSIPYVPFVAPANAVVVCTNGVPNVPLTGGSLDDGGWSGIPIGFNFNFFGNSFNTISAGTNGLLMFGTPTGYGTGAGQLGQFTFNTTGGVFPNTNNPGNVIALMAADQYFGNGTAASSSSTLTYWTQGYAPNRIFVIEYSKVDPCCSDNALGFTAQARLYETLGTVDIAVVSKTATNSPTVGLQDATKTIGAVAPGRQAFSATVTTPETWRFAPPSNYNTTWFANGVAMPSVTANPTATPPVVGYNNPGTNVFSIPVSPSATTTYSISYTNQTTGCSNPAGSAQVVMAVLGNTIPTGLTTTASATTICTGQTVNFSTNFTGITDGLVSQWQISTDAGTTWTDIASATALTYSTIPTVASQYRCKLVACNGVPGYTSAAIIGFSNSIVSTTPGLRCGTGTATVGATGSAGTTIKWYQNATGGVALGSGTSFVTPIISANTTYYAGAETYVSGALPVGAGGTNSSTAGQSLLPGFWGGSKTQYIIKASELLSAGIGAGNITSLGFEPTDSGQTYQGFSVSLAPVTVDVMTTTFISAGLTQVYAGTLTDNGFTPVANTVNNLAFGTGTGSASTFNWDGSSNILVSVSWSSVPGAFTSNPTTMKVDNVGFVSTAYDQADSLDPATMLASTTADATTSFRPRFTINGQVVCSSVRVPVVVTVTTPPALVLSGTTTTICAESNSAPVTVATGASSYDSYVWSTPTTVTGNSTSGWVFNPLTTTNYTLSASQTTGATPCATTASVTVNVNPTPSILSIDPASASACADLVLPLVTSGGTIGATGQMQIGSGTLANTLSTPYKVFWGGSKTQALYTAAELTSLGLIAGSSISSIGHVILTGVPLLMNNYSVSVGFVSSTTLGTGFIAAPTTTILNNVAYTPPTGTGNIDYTLPTPIVWDGVSSLLVETCFNNNNGGGSSTNSLSVASTTVATGLNLYRTNDFSADLCSNSTTPAGTTTRPNLRIFVLGQVATTWSPITNLYTDAAGTIPYTTGTNAATVYFKTNAAAAAVTYTATATTSLGCARSTTVPVTVYQTAAPTGLQFYQFCPTGGATVSSMTPTLTGANIKWYATSTGGNALAPTTALTQGYFWASQTLNGCESPTRFLVFAISNATAAPSSSPTQQFCNSATVANLTANGTGVQWYTTATGGTALASTAVLATGTYYVSQTSGGCESSRSAVSVTVTAVPAPTGAATQSLSSLLTLGDIVVTGSNITWYATAANAASGTNPLSSTQLLANTTYYATQTINGCRSTASLAVTITTLANQDFDMTQFTYYPNPVIDLLNISYSQDMTSVKVFNIVGQQLMSKQINSNTTQIDMSSYANGAYFIQVTTENAMKTVRVIKK